LGGGINTYGYVGGNPTRYSDPFGQYAAVLRGAAAASEGIVIAYCSKHPITCIAAAISGAAAICRLVGACSTSSDENVNDKADDDTPKQCAPTNGKADKPERTCKLQIARPSTKHSWVPKGKTQCTWECKDSFGITKITRLVDGDKCPEVPDGEMAPGDHGF